jgi:hypothetical protein
MRKSLLALAALTLLAGCETRVPIRGDVAVAGGPDYYDGYYDGSYGAFDDGYWGDDGFFWYRGGDHGFHRDEAHHFQRTAGNGFNHIHGSGMHREH